MTKDACSSSSLGDRLDIILSLVRDANKLSESDVPYDLSITDRADMHREKRPNANGLRSSTPCHFTNTQQHDPTKVLPISERTPAHPLPLSASTNDDSSCLGSPTSNELNPTASTYTPVQQNMQAT